MTVAGNETTANSIAWALLELVRHPEVQHRLRKEIYERRGQKPSNSEWTMKDFEDMPYLGAVVKASKG
jgi:cytochrome P450